MMRRFLSMLLLPLTFVGPISSGGVPLDRLGLQAGAGAIDLSNAALRVGGIVRMVDPVHKTFVIFSVAKTRRFIIDVSPLTRMTLGSWIASFTDVHVGDHLTVTGAATTPVANAAIVARTIRVGSPTFTGRVIAVTAGSGGAVLLKVLASHQHVLTVAVPPTAAVLYGLDKGVIGDLAVGERVAAHGVRQDKYVLAATSVHVYLHQHTIGGTVTAATAGAPLVYTLLSPNGGGQHAIRTTAHTVYTLGGHTAAASLVQVGTHIRARGYDLPHTQSSNTPTLIATHVTILIRRHAVKKHKPTPTPIAHVARPSGSA